MAARESKNRGVLPKGYTYPQRQSTTWSGVLKVFGGGQHHKGEKAWGRDNTEGMCATVYGYLFRGVEGRNFLANEDAGKP